jgi:Resolvase, N terminal domain
VVTVRRIDRLARSTFDLFGIVKRIVDAKAQFRSLTEPWADTGTSTGRLMLAVLGGHMGRPPSLTPAQQKEATRRRAQGATLRELAEQLRPQHIHHAPRHPRSLTYYILIGRSPAELETPHANDSREGRPISDGTTSKA